MRRTGRRAVVTAVATSVVLLGGATAAQAQTLTLHDSRHDVWSGSASDPLADYQPAPQQRAGDVTMARLRYGPHNVVLTERFVRLGRTGDGNIYGFRLRTQPGLHRTIQVEAFRGGSVGWAGTVSMSRPNGQSVSCDGLHEHLDYARDLVQVRVPAGCLHDPRWVQFSAASAHITREDRWLADNPFNDRASHRGWSARVRRTVRH